MMQSKEAQLQALYRELPRLDCKRLCQESCGPIGSSREERVIIVKRAGRAPRADSSLTCVLLENGLCSVYAVRPLLCRLFGMVQAMRCPHGCVPERWLTDMEAREMLQRAEQIGGKDDRWMRDLSRAAQALAGGDKKGNR